MAEESQLGIAKIPIRADLDQLDKDLAKAQNKVKASLDKVLGPVGKLMGKVGKAAAVGVAGGVTALAGLGVAALKLASDAKGLPGVNKAFEQFGGTIEKLSKVQEASLGTIDIQSIKSTYVQLAGFNQDLANNLDKTTADMLRISKARNIPMTYLMESWGEATQKVSPMILDNLGIIVKAGPANEAYAAALGKTVDELTGEEKQLAFATAAQEALTLAASKLPPVQEDAAVKMERLQATLKDTKDTIGVGLLPVLGMLLTPLADLASKWGPKVADWAGKFGQGIQIISDAFWSAEEGFAPFSEALQALGLNAGIADTLQRIADAISMAVFAFQEGEGPIDKVASFIGSLVADITGNEAAFEQIRAIGENVRQLGERVGAFVSEHAEEFKAALIAIGAALAAAAIVSGVIAIGSALIGLLNPVTLIIAAVALLAAAWVGDWGGIQTFFTDLWENSLQPALESIRAWLEDKIPPAIEAISSFWTDTLVPAMREVWAFVQDSLVPMFEALGTLLSATLTLALTALAGLWENILLPAIQAVGNWVKDNLLPPIQDLVGELKEKLSPALETVKGWFDKGKTALEGISETIQKVTGFFQDLAAKAANFKLPPVLTPGSPTPFEMGLRGIGEALVDVTRLMLSFADSVKPEQAKIFKKISDGVQDLVSAFKDLMQMGDALTLPPLSDVSGWADQFVAIAEVLISAVMQVQERFGRNVIHKAKTDARKVGQIIERMSVDFSAIKHYDLPDLRVYGDQLVAVASTLVEAVYLVRRKFGGDTLQKAMEAAEMIGKIMLILGVEMVLGEMQDSFVEALAPWLAALDAGIDSIVTTLQSILARWGKDALSAAAATAEVVKRIVGFLGGNLVVGELQENFAELLGPWLATLDASTDQILTTLSGIAERWEREVIEELAKVGEALTKAFGVLGIKMDAEAPGLFFVERLYKLLGGLEEGAEILIPWLQRMATRWGVEVLEEAGKVSKALAGVFDVLKVGEILEKVGIQEELKDGQTRLPFLVAIEKVLTEMDLGADLIIPALMAMKDKWGAVLDEVRQVATIIKDVFGGVGDAYKAMLDFSTGDTLDLSSVAAKLAQMSQAAGLVMTGAMMPTLGEPRYGALAPAAGATVGGSAGPSAPGMITINLWGVDGGLISSYTQDYNDAGQVDIRMGEQMAVN